MDFPLIKGDDDCDYPPGEFGRCTVCAKSCGEPGEFISLSCHAHFGGKSEDMPSSVWEQLQLDFGLWWHGAHTEYIRAPSGHWLPGSNPEAQIELAENLGGGQCSFLFCGSNCLRKFFNTVVDELERRKETALHQHEQDQHLRGSS